MLVKENLPRFGEGDRVGFMINFARNQVLSCPKLTLTSCPKPQGCTPNLLCTRAHPTALHNSALVLLVTVF